MTDVPRRENESASKTAAATRIAAVFFQQGCPVCGRRLEIDINLLGRRVYCQHCGGGFVAMDPSLATGVAAARPSDHHVATLLERAAVALEQSWSDGGIG